jgi:hypothetical protein
MPKKSRFLPPVEMLILAQRRLCKAHRGGTTHLSGMGWGEQMPGLQCLLGTAIADHLQVRDVQVGVLFFAGCLLHLSFCFLFFGFLFGLLCGL